MPAARPQPSPLPRLAHAYWHDLLSAMGARRITSTVLLLLGTAALDAASLAGLLQLMRVLGGHGLALPSSWAAALNPHGLAWALALFVGLAWLRGVAGRHSERSMVSLRMDHVNRLRQRLEAALAGSPWARLSQLSHSAAQHLLFQQMQRVQQGTHQLMQLLSGLGVALATLAVAAWVAPWWTALLSGLALALLWAARASLGKAAAMGAEMGLSQQALLDRTREFLSGLKQVKAAGEEPQYLQAFAQRSEQLKATQLAFIDHQARTRARFEVAGLLVFAGLLWALSSWSRLPWPELLLLVLAFARVWPAARNAQQQLQQLAHALPAFAEIEQAITASTNTSTRANTTTNATSATPRPAADTARTIEAASTTPLPLEASLALQGVHAGAGADDTLHGVTLQLQAHQLIALTGPSGAGKTTLADVLVGLLTPRAGQVVLDGQPLTPDGPMLPRWQRAVAYVTQEPFLMAGTVRANLCWPGPAQPDAALWEALARSDARGFVEGLPGGLDHPLGEHGSGLSGGERQRLALARALLRRPSLLVLDEATSQLDAASEARVLSGLRELLATTTIVAVAHRPAVLHQADRLITLDHGRVVSDAPDAPAMAVVTAHPKSAPRTTHRATSRATPRLTPRVVWFTGLSGAGKSTIAEQVVARLQAQGQPVQLLDGDLLRHGLNSDLGFSLADRTENIRRVAEVARVLVDAGVVTLAALISPLAHQREMARRIVGDDDFLEVHVDTALAVAEQRDVKGLYAKARRGELRDFTGIDSPYEAPLAADLRIDTARLSPEQAAEQVLSLLATARFASPAARAAP